MKINKLFYCFVLSMAISSLAVAQSDDHGRSSSSGMPKLSDFNTWQVGLHFGIMYANTDIASSDLNGDNVRNQLGYGIKINKFFSHAFALQAHFLTGSLEGLDKRKLYGFHTDVDYQISLNAMLQIGNSGFLKRTPNLGLYAFAGVGIISFSPVNDSAGFKITGRHYTNYYIVDNIPPAPNQGYNPTTEFCIPLGLGMRYRIAKQFSVNAEVSYTTMTSDKLDGWNAVLTSNDGFTYINMGLTYHIGKKDKTIEWVNPLQTIYSDLYDTKEKVDLMGGDKDKDGVADMFDKDNSTPDGIKVYGDGTAVDTDGDGVPDYLDGDPFSAKGAKVDASGKEIDEDGDGVPDSRDMEPNTAKGTLVDANGNTIPIFIGAGGTASVSAGYVPSVFFDNNSSVISPKFYEQLADVALIMKNNPSLKFDLIGNCDTRANDDYNKALGEKRAMAVKNHFVKKYNIDPSRFNIDSKGRDEPITQDNRMNRRVDFRATTQ